MASFGSAVGSPLKFLVALAATVLPGAADLQVPSAPTDALLEVVSGDSLALAWASPMTDGGAAVQSYQVEWDTDPGRAEVQTVTTSTYIGANELQTISTSAADIDEIQNVTTVASPIREVQTVTATAPVGGTLAGTFALALDTRVTGGSLQYTGAIPADAATCCGRTSMTAMVEALSNVGSGNVYNVSREAVDVDGGVGWRWRVTFDRSLADVPQLQLLDASALTLGSSIALGTAVEGNAISGAFRLSFNGDTTALIPSDATAGELEDALELLDTITDVTVIRGDEAAFGGFTWWVTFVHDDNAGDVPLLEPVWSGTLLGTSGDPWVNVTEHVPGNELSGSFNISFNGNAESAKVPFDATVSELANALQSLPQIPDGTVAVTRTGPDFELGYVWTVSFLDDVNRTFEGDVSPLTVSSSTYLGGQNAQVDVAELRKGTVKEIQRLNVTRTSNKDDAFYLTFRGETTGAIYASPDKLDKSCGSAEYEVQQVRVATQDTTSAGGDGTVSPRTTFRLSYGSETTDYIYANDGTGDCSVAAGEIETELEKFDAFYQVDVSYSATVAAQECWWNVTFSSSPGNVAALTVSASREGVGAEDGPASSASIGDDTLYVRELVSGKTDLVQSELEGLSTIGRVTVDSRPDPINALTCLYTITFDTNAGYLPLIGVATSGTDETGEWPWADTNTTVNVTRIRSSTSEALSGDFALEFRGQRTGYLTYDSSSYDVEAALESLSTIGSVAVNRTAADENGGHTWSITFLSELGDVPMLVADDLDMSGTAVTATTYLVTQGVFPPFNSLDEANGLPLGSAAVTDLADLQLEGPASLTTPPYAIPVPAKPSEPTDVALSVLDSTSLRVVLADPLRDGGDSVDSYRVEYAGEAFTDEVQAVRIYVNSTTEVQVIETNVTEKPEIQLVHALLDPSYAGATTVEWQLLECDASGGSFTLTFDGLTTRSIAYDADEATVKSALQELTNVNKVTVAFVGVGLLSDGVVDTACVDGGDSRVDYADSATGFTAGMNITFNSVSDYVGDVPALEPYTNELDGLRRVVVTEFDGDWGLGGTFKLTFRGATTDAIVYDASASAVESALIALDTIQQGGVEVSDVSASMSTPYDSNEHLWEVTFVGSGVGGDVEALQIRADDDLLTGSGARLRVYADGSEKSSDIRSSATAESRAGSELGGSFTLTLRQHTTEPIEFNAAASTMKARLEALPNVGNVDVLRSAPGSRREYAWTVSFVSNPGYFPPNSRNLALLVPDTSDLEGTGASCEVKERLQGSEPLKGAFQLMFCNSTYADGYADACEYTDLLENDLEAPQFEAILEDLDHVGDVDVSRVTNSDGYTWYITFGGCSLTEDLEDVCNEGDVALMKWLESNSTLTGGSSAPNVTIEEVVRGTGPGTCSDRVDEDGKCVAVETDLSGGEPYAYDILGLETGERVYVRARWHNELGFGPYSLSEPEYETPTWNAPGAPPAVRLLNSSAVSVAVAWDRPTEDGGAPVMGYELWLDNWEGGASRIVFDGSDQPDTMAFTVRTKTSVGVESGKQYRSVST
ncbi:hypothetical protein JL722_12143 [Aureococcus anophagefferens]|nr:hypothetical protein JL722_12143 [Aureococcus anophagefferens]